MVFYIKKDGNFTRKAQLVENGHNADAPASITYSSVASREIVRIYFLIASLNELDICACYIGKTYLKTNFREKL